MLIIQRSQIAAFSCFRTLARCPQRPYIPSCAEHGAGVGRSSTERSYETVRKGRSGKSTGAVDETATGSANFFGPTPSAAPPLSPRLRSPRCTASSAEHRPGRHRPHVGGRPRGVHLLRPDRGRSERRDCDRARARLVRGDLAVRAAARRGSPRDAAGAPTLAATPRRRPGRPERARRGASGRARVRARPRAAPAREQPPDRGSRGALRAAAPPVASWLG